VTTGRTTAAAPPLSDGDYQALARFRHALRVFQRLSEEAARDAGVTPAQHQLLLSVRGHAGDAPPVVSDLAEALQLRHHSVVELVDRAEAAGLVRRTADPDDQRRQHVRLTRKGSALLERLSLVHRDELRRFRVEMLDVLRELDRSLPIAATSPARVV
jgi:DNA-binding MarR family transcriptional regulator